MNFWAGSETQMTGLSKVSENLKELLTAHGLSQTALADKTRIGRATLSDILNAKSAPGFGTLLSLAEYFHCSADFLLGLKDYPCEEYPYLPAPPFGERLRVLLRETGKSQYGLVHQKHISWSVLHGWLTGNTFPGAENLVKLAGYCQCSVDELLGRV